MGTIASDSSAIGRASGKQMALSFDAPTRRRSVRFVWQMQLIAMLLAALWLRVDEFDRLPGLNGDEAWYGVQALSLLAGEPFESRTPTGNVLNPFYFVPLVAVHAMYSASIAALRSVALVSGLLAIAVNWLLCRRVFGEGVASATSLALAVLPINVAYSRFGWDTSQTLLFSVPVVYGALLAVKEASRAGRWMAVSWVCLVAAIVVHPTNVFLLPMPLVASTIAVAQPLSRLWRWLRQYPLATVGACGLLLCVAIVAVWMARGWLDSAPGRVFNIGEIARFASAYVRLLSGVTAYQYIPGSLLPDGQAYDTSSLIVLLFDGLVAVLVAVASWGWCYALRQGAQAMDMTLLAGWALIAVGFYLVAGPGAIAPHFERYGLCLIVPAVVVVSRGIAIRLTHTASTARALWTLTALGWLSLVGFQVFYLSVFEASGGRSHRAFRVAEGDPKQMALRQIASIAEESEVTIVTTEWWTYWPLRYLACGETIRVVLANEPDASLTDATGGGSTSIWYVEFVDAPNYPAAREQLLSAEGDWRETLIRDARGRPILALFSQHRRHS